MAEYHMTEELLEKNSVRKLILRLGIPAMFGQFFNMLYRLALLGVAVQYALVDGLTAMGKVSFVFLCDKTKTKKGITVREKNIYYIKAGGSDHEEENCSNYWKSPEKREQPCHAGLLVLNPGTDQG